MTFRRFITCCFMAGFQFSETPIFLFAFCQPFLVVSAWWWWYQLGLMLFDRKAAVWAAVLAALSSYQIYHSQQARPYALWMLLTLGSYAAYIAVIIRPRIAATAAYLLCSLLMLYTHPYSSLLILAQNVHFFFWVRKNTSSQRLKIRHWFFLQGGLLLMFLPWLAVVFHRFIQIQQIGAAIPRPKLVDLPECSNPFRGIMLIWPCFLWACAFWRCCGRSLMFLPSRPAREYFRHGYVSKRKNSIVIVVAFHSDGDPVFFLPFCFADLSASVRSGILMRLLPPGRPGNCPTQK